MEEQLVELKLLVERRENQVISYAQKIVLHVPLMEKALHHLQVCLLVLGK